MCVLSVVCQIVGLHVVDKGCDHMYTTSDNHPNETLHYINITVCVCVCMWGIYYDHYYSDQLCVQRLQKGIPSGDHYEMILTRRFSCHCHR